MAEMKERVLRVEGLDCAHCAAKVERAIRLVDGVEEAYVDFVAQTVTIRADEERFEEVCLAATKTACDIEPDIYIAQEGKKVEKTSEHFFVSSDALMFSLGTMMFLAAFFTHDIVRLALFSTAYILIGFPVLWVALKNGINGHVFDENFLMSIATVGAFAIGEYPEGVAVMLFYRIGEYFQDLAVERSRKSIESLMDIRPDVANVITRDGVQNTPVQEVDIGSLILVKPGEKIPLDGTITSGRASIDSSALTGEAIPKDVGENMRVLAGCINLNGILEIRVDKLFAESTVSKILTLVQQASQKKATTENFITVFARYYTPAVVLASLCIAFIPPLLISDALFSEWFRRALIFLVVSCPCALVISIPLTFFGGIGAASRNGILVKGGNYLEALCHVDTIVFDKTGTLTKGVFIISRIHTAPEWSEDELLTVAAAAEQFSNHPVAKAIQQGVTLKNHICDVAHYTELPGLGVRALIDGRDVVVGNDVLMEQYHIMPTAKSHDATVIHIGVDGKYAGSIEISDELKVDSKDAIIKLRQYGVKHVCMLTGDTKVAAQKVASAIGIDSYHAQLLPQEKVEKVEALQKAMLPKRKLLFVGDGINDAPVLARSDIGVAMGSIGSDAAIEAADIVLMNDEPSKLVSAIAIAKRTNAIVWQNIIFALGTKGIILVLGTLGVATLWEAVFGDVGVALIATLNAARILRTRAA